MKGICHIVGAGDFDPSLLNEIGEGDLVIAADAGLLALEKAGIRAHLYLGDGDSLGYIPQGIDAVVLPKIKDDTDTLSAIREGLDRGYRRFFLYGALGGKRFSHTLANLQSLSFLKEEGADGVIVDRYSQTRMLSPGEHTFAFAGGFFSLFAWEGEAVVSIQGAKYELENARLTPSFPLGVSNEGTDKTVISVHRGKVILVREAGLL